MTPDDVAAMYNHYMAELARIGTSEFNLTPGQARNTAHEVLVAYLGSRNRIEDLQAWLTAAMRSAAAPRRNRAEV